MEGLYPMERKMLLPPQRAFSPDLQEICYPRARRDILSIEREIDEQTWAQLEGRRRSPVPVPSHSYSAPRSSFKKGDFRIFQRAFSGPIGILSSTQSLQNTEWGRSHIMSGKGCQRTNMTGTCEFSLLLFQLVSFHFYFFTLWVFSFTFSACEFKLSLFQLVSFRFHLFHLGSLHFHYFRLWV